MATITRSESERPIGFGRLKRKEDARFLTGRGTYTDDINRPGQLHAYMVDQAVSIWVVHDANPRALSPKVKGFNPAQSWSQDFTQISMA